MTRPPTLLLATLTALATALMSACASAPPPRPAGGLAELMDRPGERALVEGIRAYDDGQYAPSEAALRKAALQNSAAGGPIASVRGAGLLLRRGRRRLRHPH